MKKLLVVCLIMLVLCSCGGKTEIIIKELPDEPAVPTMANGTVGLQSEISSSEVLSSESRSSYEDYRNDSQSESASSKKSTSSKSVVATSSKKAAPQNQKSGPYVLNTKTKKFHFPSCAWADKISAENKSSSNNRTQLINDGYDPCGHCKP